MSIFRKQIKTLLIFFLVFLPMAGSAQDTPESRIIKVFAEMVKSLSDSDLSAGNCVANSTRFYRELEKHELLDDDARIVLMVREPNQGMPNPMYPNKRFLRGSPANFWIWHAFVLTQNLVFDCNYKIDGENLNNYFKNFWSTDRNFSSFWVFAVRIEDLPEITGSNYPGGPPKMLRFKPISPAQLLKNPRHLTRPGN